MNSFGATKFLFAAVALLYLSTGLRSIDAFDPSKLYKYDFQGAITNKLADNDKPQYSGYSIKSSILLKKSDDDLVLKLDQPQLAIFNDVINEIHQYNYNYKPIEKAASLDKPFKIYFEGNQAKALDTYKDEPRWVSNFKRGLVSFFQLQLQKDGSFFSVKENSVFGNCETDYIVSDSDGLLNVTKTRNMAKCKSRYFNRFFPIETNECVESEKDLEEFKHSNAIFNYNLKGTKQDYVIERVILDEMNLFAPFGQKAHSHSVHTKFMIALNKADEGGSLSTEEDVSRNERIAFEPAENLDFYASTNMENEHYHSNILDLSSTSVEQVMEVMDDLVEEHRKYNAAFEGQLSEQPNYQQSSTLIHQMYRLTQLVGTFNYKKLEQLYNQVDERGDAHKKVFWDLMSMIGTNPSFIFMKKLIGEGDAPAAKIKEYLPKMSFHLKTPSKALFDEYINLCKSDKVAGNQQYKRLCSLPLASLIHQHCVKPHAKALRNQQPEEPETVCQLKTAEEYFRTLVVSLSDSSELGISGKHFNIKMAGELGVKSSLDYLTEIAKNKEEHPTLRAAALWNMFKAANLYPNQVKTFVVPIYYDQSEPTELRIAAFYCWLKSGIGLHEMETLGKQLRVEQNRQVVAYMSSFVDSLAKLSSTPCTRPLEKSAKLVAPTIKRALKAHQRGSQQSSQWDSKVFMTSTWNEDYSYGTATAMSAIFTNDSVTPVNLFYKSAEMMSGIRLYPMTVNLQAHRADKVLKRVVGPSGILSGKESFFDIFSLKKHAKREAESSKPDRFTDVYLAATISVYGRTVTFVDIESKELKKMMSEDGTVRIPNVKKLLHSFNNHSNPSMMLLFEKLDMTNNELGLPIFQMINDFQFKNFKLNTIKVDIEPGFFKDERKGKPPTRLTASVDMRSVRHNEFFIGTGALLTNERRHIGVGLSKKKILTMPLKLSIDANLVENKLVLKREPIHENLLYIKQLPYTYVRSYDPSKAVHTSNSQWLYHYDLNNATQMSPLKIDYMTRLGIGLKMEGKNRAGSDWSVASWRKYLMQLGLTNAKFMYFYSPTGAPFEVALSTITTEENPTKELTTTITWNHHNKEDSSGLNSVEKELELFTRDSDEKAKTVHYHFSLAGGSVKERKIDLDLAYSRSLDHLRHKWRVFYDRPEPLQGSQSTNFSNFCWNGQMEMARGDMEKLIRFDPDDTIRMANDVKLEGECPVSKLETEKASIKALREKFSALVDQSRQKLRDY